MKVCSHCGGTEFSVSVVEYQSWKVDGEGNFIEDLGCDEVDREGADMTCTTCYASPAFLTLFHRSNIMTKQEIINDEILFQRACALWVERNIGQCVSSLMYDVGQNLDQCAKIFDFDYDEAIGWFQREDYESAVDSFIDDADLDDLETIADMVGDWEGVVYSVLGMSPEEYADEVTSEGDQAEDLKALRTEVKTLITNDSEYTEIGQHFNLDPDYCEVYEHWTIPEGWTARELEDEGQVVFEFGGMTIWGRMTTGQCISLDGVTARIVKSLPEDHWIWSAVK